jgi:F-type H+-transporting ATPase subunit epsilon
VSNENDKTFHCELIDPKGKLLDQEVAAVVLPAHDGHLGILYNHMPMLCQLGLGIMKVSPAPPEQRQEAPPSDLFFFIDGGSALVAQNEVTVIAYDALSLQEVQTQQIEALIDKTARNAADTTLSAGQRAHEDQRLRALQRLAESRQRE